MGIVVNMSGQEASSECEIAEVKNPPKPGKKDNRGKPFYKLEFTVQESAALKTPEKYVGRKVWSNAMLFEGALYTIVQLMKALDYSVTEGAVEIPEPEDLIGKEVILQVTVQKERTEKDAQTGEEKTYAPRNDVRTFWPLEKAAEGNLAPTGKASYLP